MRKWHISEPAQNDLSEIHRYIARDNPDAADRTIRKLIKTIESLAETPGIGQIRPDLWPGLRCFPSGRYVVFFRTRADSDVAIEIVRVIHGARDFDQFFRSEH